MFSVLQLFRHYNDVLFGSLGRSMSLHQRALLAYFAHLKTRHPLLKTLLAVLNVIRLVQVPMEMLILKLAPTHRSIFVLALELGKFALKFGVWQGSGWRIVPKHLSVPVDRQRLAEETWKSSAPNAKNKDEPVWRLEEQMRQLELQMKQTADPAAGLHRYLKGHKHNIYTANPQLVFHPAVGWAAWTRELAHLARPSIYGRIRSDGALTSLFLVLGLMVCSGGSLRNDHPNETILRTWAPLLISLALDLYSKWPDLGDGLRLRPNISVLEAEERARRLLDLLYYPLRSPVYGTITSSIIDALETKLAAWPALAPLVGIIERSALTVDSHI